MAQHFFIFPDVRAGIQKWLQRMTKTVGLTLRKIPDRFEYFFTSRSTLLAVSLPPL